MERRYSRGSIYNLSAIKERSFRFPAGTDGVVQSVDMRRLHLDLGDNDGEQFTLCLTVPKTNSTTIHALLNKILNMENLRLEDAAVVEVEFCLSSRSSDKSAEKSYFTIGASTGSTLRSKKKRRLAKDCLRRWGVLNA